MIHGLEYDPSWEESWDEAGSDVDEFNLESGNAQHMEYYFIGYYPSDPWNQEESWEEEATEENKKLNEQG